MLRILVADISAFDAETYPLPPRISQRFSKTVSREARLERIGGYAALARLCSLCGAAPADIRYENGRPRVGNDLFAGISHSGGLSCGKYRGAAAAALSDSEVGVDIELVRTVDLRVAHRFTDSEKRLVTSSGAPYEEFFRVWTAKESFVKFTGEGLARGLSSFSLSPDAGGFVVENMSEIRIFTYLCGDCVLSVCTNSGETPQTEFAAF